MVHAFVHARIVKMKIAVFPCLVCLSVSFADHLIRCFFSFGYFRLRTPHQKWAWAWAWGCFLFCFIYLSKYGKIALTRSYFMFCLFVSVCLFVCWLVCLVWFGLAGFAWDNDITTLPITTVCTISLCDEVKVYLTEEMRVGV